MAHIHTIHNRSFEQLAIDQRLNLAYYCIQNRHAERHGEPPLLIIIVMPSYLALADIPILLAVRTSLF